MGWSREAPRAPCPPPAPLRQALWLCPWCLEFARIKRQGYPNTKPGKLAPLREPRALIPQPDPAGSSQEEPGPLLTAPPRGSQWPTTDVTT